MTIIEPLLNGRSFIGLAIHRHHRINEQIVGNRAFKIRRAHFNLNMDKKLGSFLQGLQHLF